MRNSQLFVRLLVVPLLVVLGAFATNLSAQRLAKGDLPTSATATVPRIDIRFTNGGSLSDVHLNKETYQAVSVTIDGGGGYPDLAATAAEFRGRGNTTWSYPKKPYRIKFSKKTSPLGLTKAKSWALLANYQYNAQLSGAIAMKAAQMVGATAANHIVPVELYVDGQYLGLYNLTEHVSLSDASVVVPDEKKAALLELDTYFDEDTRFRDDNFNLPVNLKSPSLSDLASDSERSNYMQQLTQRFNHLTFKIANNDPSFESLIDVASLARYIFVNELIGNLEINHPKSSYLFTTQVADTTARWQFGPVWDADWAYGYELDRGYGTSDPEFGIFSSSVQDSGTRFYGGMLDNSPKTRQELARLYDQFVNNGGIDTLTSFIDRYYAFTASAMARDRSLWHQSDADYAGVAARLKTWLTRRANYLNTQHSGDLVTGVARIEQNATANSGVDISTLPAATAVYALDGRRAGSLDQLRAKKLPKGVYVVAGQRFVLP